MNTARGFFVALSSLSLSLVVACSTSTTSTSGGGNAGNTSQGGGGSSQGGGGAGGASGGAGGLGGSSQGGGGAGGAEPFSCDVYCATVVAHNVALECNEFDCATTCPAALETHAASGCSAEGLAVFECVSATPIESWFCDGANELTYDGPECAELVTALIDCTSG
jgi:hypothetical protein